MFYKTSFTYAGSCLFSNFADHSNLTPCSQFSHWPPSIRIHFRDVDVSPSYAVLNNVGRSEADGD